MLTTVAEFVYNAYLAELRKGSAGSNARKKQLRRIRRFLLKLTDPDIIARIDGFLFRTPFSSNIVLFQFDSPLYDAVLPRLARLMHAARGGLVMVDVGANVGAVTYRASRDTPGHFLCIEANPRFKASLTHNLAQIPKSRARFAALTNESRHVTVRHNYIDGNSNIEPAAEGGDLLEFVTLDEALGTEVNFPTPNLVKIDTEGFELKILNGASRMLREIHPPLFIEFFPEFIRREGGEPDALFDLLGRHGYDRFIFYDGGGNLLASVTRDQTEQLQSLRRYCELRRSFFDVAAFHTTDAALCRDFERAERDFFEQFLRPRNPLKRHEKNLSIS